MPKTLEQKKAIVATLEDSLKKSKSAVFISFDRVSVAQVTKAREECFKRSVKYITTKKSLLGRVLKESGFSPEALRSSRQVAVAFSLLDEVSGAKILYEMSKAHEGVKLLGGILEKKYLDAEGVLALAELPSKEELFTRLVVSLAFPLTGIVSVFSGSIRDFVNILGKIAKQQELRS